MIVIDHLIHNLGSKPFECAPWAITQFKLGGEAILPLGGREKKQNSLLPDRSIVLWPYTNINDSRICWDNDFIFIKPEPIGQPLKIGLPNREKWMAYFVDHLLFIKYTDEGVSRAICGPGRHQRMLLQFQIHRIGNLGLPGTDNCRKYQLAQGGLEDR